MAEVALQTGHVGLNVTNLARSKQFYGELFNFEVLGESSQPGREYAFLGAAGQLLLTLWQQSRGQFSSQNPGLHHLSFQVGSIDEVRQLERKLRQLQTKIYHQGIVPHGEGMASGGIYFEDPDGIRLEVYAASGADTAPAPTPDGPTCGFF